MMNSDSLLQPEKIAELIAQVDTNIEAYNIFRAFRNYMKELRFVIASQKGPMPGLSVNKNFSSGAAVRSLFASDYVIVLDDVTIEDMESGGAVIPIDFSISLDTQAFSYFRPYLKEVERSLPIDIAEVMHFVANPAVNIDPIPYLFENHRTIIYGSDEEREKLFDNIVAYELFRSVDKDFLSATGKIRSYLSEQERRTRAIQLVSEITYRHSQECFSNELIRHQRVFYCILLKMVEIQFRKKRAPLADKVIDFLSFLDAELGAMFAREMILATKYFQMGQRLGFFGKIQANSNEVFSNLTNMSWDLYHIRQCEKGLSFKSSEGARYYFPALLTFDKRFIEIIDLCPLKMCVITPEQIVQPVYVGDLYKKVAGDAEELASRIYKQFYSEDARKARDERRRTGDLMSRVYLDGLIQRVEGDLAKAAGVKTP